MTDPRPTHCIATYFDGLSARPHPVRLALKDHLEIEGEGLSHAWDYDAIQLDEEAGTHFRLARPGAEDRIEFGDGAFRDTLVDVIPGLRQRGSLDGAARMRIVLWSLAAGLGILLVVVFGVPVLAKRLLPAIPHGFETRFGASVEAQLVRLLGKPPLCEAPAGKAALDRLAARMTEGLPLPGPLELSVRRHATANALTLPGARVVVLSGLIDQSHSPEEFAGVLAHEIGHVIARDPMRAVLEAAGTSGLLGLVLGDLTGSTILVSLGQAALSASHARAAEDAADAYAVGIMRRLDADGTALASILSRIAGDGSSKDFASFLRSHPFTRSRVARIRAEARTDGETTPIVSGKEWQAIREICLTTEVAPD